MICLECGTDGHMIIGECCLECGHIQGRKTRKQSAERIAELEATLRTVRAAIVEKAEDTFWLTPIETVVDHIDAVLGDYADAQAELSI